MRSLAMVLAVACALAGCPDASDEGVAGSGAEMTRWAVYECHTRTGFPPNEVTISHGERCIELDGVPHGEELLARWGLSCAATPGLQCPYGCEMETRQTERGLQPVFCDNRD